MSTGSPGPGRPHRRPIELPGGEIRSQVFIGAGLLEDPPAEVLDWLDGRRVFVISSRELLDLHGPRLELFERRAAATIELEVPDGEACKNLDTAGWLWRELLDKGGKRDSRVIAFGGGSVGDLAGFVAGAFLRGIEFLQVPTTLLAQVDASVGGKTAIDLPGGKNTVGLFHHPPYVLADTSLLDTLSADERRSGLVEVVKMAALLDPGLFEFCEREAEALLAGEAGALATAVAGAVEAKCGVVEEDPTETRGRRQVLNLGHTLGHAIEKELNYGHLRHGEAVAYGTLFACRLARARGVMKPGGTEGDIGERLLRLFDRFGLPRLPTEKMTVDGLTAAMARDKKATRKGLTWVLPEALGVDVLDDGIGTDLVQRELEAFLEDPWAPAAASDPGAGS